MDAGGGSTYPLVIGCGTGNYTIPFASEFETTYGLDIEEAMLAVARTKSSAVRWTRANGIQTGLAPASCDAVWLISTLHYFKGESQMYLFKEIYRVLKSGGVLVADTEFTEQNASLWLKEYFPSLRNRYNDALFSERQYQAWLHQVGFVEVSVEPMVYDASEGDAFLRVGQHQPELYLQSRIRDAIPAFKQMAVAELTLGLAALRRAIEDRSIDRIIAEYQAKATMSGDLGFIVAKK